MIPFTPAVRRGPRRAAPRRGDAGFTAAELAVASAISLVVFGVFTSAITDAIGTAVTTVSSTTLQEDARRVLERLRRDVTMSGRIAAAVDPTGVDLPAVFSNGEAAGGLAAFAHDEGALATIALGFAPAPEPPEPFSPPAYVAPGNEWEPYGFRDFIFRLPRDVDGDGRIVNAAGAIEWGPELFGYLTIPRPNDKNGLCDLVRRTINADGSTVDDVVCRQIESATFDIVTTKEVLPAPAVEVHLHLLREDGQGAIRRLHVATTLVMRN
jgi:hypothetical protein